MRTRTLQVLILMGIAVLLITGCNKTAEDTNKPVIIQSFKFTVDGDPVTPSGTLQIEPGSVMTIEVVYTDPDAGADEDPGNYSYMWAVERIGSTTAIFNPNEFFIVFNENPCIWTGPDVTGFYRFLVEVRDRYGTPTQQTVVVEVNDNKQPLISELNVSNASPYVNEEVTITVEASDPDGNLPLEWDWQATGGYFVSEGEGEAVWLSPSSGEYTITVSITDQVGGNVSRSVPIIVQANHDPVIEGFDLDPGNSVKYEEQVTITITADDIDGDPLEYNWSSDKGMFSSVNKNVAVWRAPMETVSAVISCTVEDNKGGSDSVDIVINVTE